MVLVLIFFDADDDQYRAAGSKPKKTDSWTAPTTDVIQVLSPGMTQYIGELSNDLTDVLCSIMARGLLRLEGFALRIPSDGVSYNPDTPFCLLVLTPRLSAQIHNQSQLHVVYPTRQCHIHQQHLTSQQQVPT